VKGEAFVKLYRDLLESDAWRSLSINARRLLDFLMIEHMRHGGKRNGFLLAPREQLEKCGIGARHISPAIEEAERVGLVDCKRGVGQRPSMYTLTWLQLSDGSDPSNRWRFYLATSEGKPLLMTSEGKSQGYPKGSHKARSDFRREVTNPQNNDFRREAPLKKRSYQGGDAGSVLEGRGGEQKAGTTCSWYVTNGTGHRLCGKPNASGRDKPELV
jgi:hypothetical protein